MLAGSSNWSQILQTGSAQRTHAVGAGHPAGGSGGNSDGILACTESLARLGVTQRTSGRAKQNKTKPGKAKHVNSNRLARDLRVKKEGCPGSSLLLMNSTFVYEFTSRPTGATRWSTRRSSESAACQSTAQTGAAQHAAASSRACTPACLVG